MVRRHVPGSALSVIGFVIAVMLVPPVYAQLPSGGARVALRITPIPTPAAGSPLREELQQNQLLVGPGPILAATTTNLFAQVAIGAGYTTVFSFLNTGVDATLGNLILTASSGQPMTASFASPGLPNSVGSAFPISLPSGGSQVITATTLNPATDPISVGWARVESSGGDLGGVATFQLALGTELTTIVGVLSAPATSAATIPIDDDHSVFRDTGYAIANPGNTPINIKMVLVLPDGTVHQTFFPPGLNPLPPGRHVASFIWQDTNDPFLLYRGSVVMIEQGGQPFSMVALVLNKSLFTAIPVIPGSAPGVR